MKKKIGITHNLIIQKSSLFMLWCISFQFLPSPFETSPV